MSGDNLRSMLIRPLLAGGIGYAASMLMYNQGVQMEIKPLGLVLSTPVAMGIASAVGDGIAQLFHGAVMPHLSKNSKLMALEGLVSVPLLAGAATLGVALVFDEESVSQNMYYRPFAVGAGAGILAEYVDSTFVTPMIAS